MYVRENSLEKQVFSFERGLLYIHQDLVAKYTTYLSEAMHYCMYVYCSDACKTFCIARIR